MMAFRTCNRKLILLVLIFTMLKKHSNYQEYDEISEIKRQNLAVACRAGYLLCQKSFGHLQHINIIVKPAGSQIVIYFVVIFGAGLMLLQWSSRDSGHQCQERHCCDVNPFCHSLSLKSKQR